MSVLSKDFTYAEFYMRENALVHQPVEREMNFYDCVMRGDMKAVEKAFTPLGGEGFGVLSENPLMSLKYHLVITIAFMTRFCIDGGMGRENAYNLSDFYILRADRAKSADEINDLHKKAVRDFTERMAKLSREKKYSKPVIDCFEYVYKHLNERIKLVDIAAALGLSAPYLSNLFHKETGVTINRYINKKRVETAARMLVYSDYDASYIANALAFSSHSRFIQVFKAEMGLTPHEYRQNHYYVKDI